MFGLTKNFKPGQFVTWGNGGLRAKILELKDGNAKIELTHEAIGGDGSKFPAGFTSTMPIEHVRHLS